MTANEILAAVGDDGEGHPATYIQILRDMDTEEGHIILDADHIILNGEVIANTIETGGLYVRVTDSRTEELKYSVMADGTGLTATNITVIGTVRADNGFFGTSIQDPVTLEWDDYAGVKIVADGLQSSNYGENGNFNQGFRLSANDQCVLAGWHLGNGILYSGSGNKRVTLASDDGTYAI